MADVPTKPGWYFLNGVPREVTDSYNGKGDLVVWGTPGNCDIWVTEFEPSEWGGRLYTQGELDAAVAKEREAVVAFLRAEDDRWDTTFVAPFRILSTIEQGKYHGS